MTRNFRYTGKAKRLRVDDKVMLQKGVTFTTADELLAVYLAGLPDVEEVKVADVKTEKPSRRTDAVKP